MPFKPTGAQLRAVKDCVADMQGKYPMNRLLQGDVGSGKTAVAAGVIYVAVEKRLSMRVYGADGNFGKSAILKRFTKNA